MSKASRLIRHIGIATATIAVAMPYAAQADTAGAAIIASAVANVSIATNCRTASAASFTTAQVAGGAALISRPATRPMSALDRIKMQQANPQAMSAVMTEAQQQAVAARPSYMPAIAAIAETGRDTGIAAGQGIVPAAIGINCATTFDGIRPRVSAKIGDFLESRILPVSTTAFDAAWNRVASDRAGQRAVIAADEGGAMVERIAGVNRWVNRKVAYKADAELYGQSDYWATASETLRRGQGDCEDYAIAKMQILAAMGVAREDMYLTLARDLVRRDDHAVLVVKVEGRTVLLDNATDELLDGDVANDYRPILSFSAGKRYLHGY